MDRCAPQCCPPSLDPFCMQQPKSAQQQYYFNPFLHAQCLGVDMNTAGLKLEIQQCQEEYKKKVWSILKKYTVEDSGQQRKKPQQQPQDEKNASNTGRNARRTK